MNLNFPLSFTLQIAGVCQRDRCEICTVYSTDSLSSMAALHKHVELNAQYIDH